MARLGRGAVAAALIGAAVMAASGGSARAASLTTAGGASGTRSAAARRGGRGAPDVRSNMALVIDAAQGTTLFSKHAGQVAPIASITKLMTAMVVLDAQLPLDEPITIDRADVDTLKHSRSRLPVGESLERGELLRVALMASDNRAAAALARTSPGGTAACVDAMNRKAQALRMPSTRFADPTGLSGDDVSSAEDLARLALAASGYPMIREATTTSSRRVTLGGGRVLVFHNSNRLVSSRSWNIGLSKTGYINEAGRCLLMQAEIAARRVVIVLLDSWGRYTRLGDAGRIRRWMESSFRASGTAGPALVPLAPPPPGIVSSGAPSGLRRR